MGELLIRGRLQSRTAIIPFAASYDALVDSFGLDVESYWKFDETSGTTITDTYGTQNAVLTGTPERNVDTIVQFDSGGKCIAWPGTVGEYAQAAHNAAHKTPSGTIAVTFQSDTLSEKSILVAADAAAAAGGLSVEVNTNGSARAFLRNSAGTPIVITGAAGDVQLANAYTLIFKWGFGGLSLALWDANGILVRRVTNVLTDGVTGTSAIRFGAWHTDINHHDGPYGRVVWMSRRISDIEEATLAKAHTITHGESGEYITTPEAHGWSAGNTVAQNTAAFNIAISNANANAGGSSTGRGVVELVQGKLYTVNTTNGVNNNGNGAIIAQNNVEIRTTGKPTRPSGNQAIIQFESWSGKTGVHNQLLFKSRDAAGWFLGWVTLDGNKNSISSIANVNYTQGGDGGIYNIHLMTGTANFTVKEVISRMSLTDGLVTNEKFGGVAPTNGLFEDCTFTRNRRQGYSTGKTGVAGNGFDQVVFRRCTFSDTGDFAGDVPGQKPGDGVDMEPAQASEDIAGVTFDDCDFTGNLGSQWHLGVNTGSFDPGAGLYVDMKARMLNFKCLNCRNTNNRSGVVLALWDGPNWDQLFFENLVISGNATNNQLLIGSHGTPSPGIGTLTNTTIINTNTPSIFFQSDLAATGHSIAIWRGNFNPTITTNSRTTITINNGFPP